jgi:hypothetical protein
LGARLGEIGAFAISFSSHIQAHAWHRGANTLLGVTLSWLNNA